MNSITPQMFLWPIGFYVFYIFFLGLYNLRTRVLSVKTGETSPKFFKTYSHEEVSKKVLIGGRHFDNQFQLPLVFMVTCLTYFSMQSTSTLGLLICWIFVISRLGHSWVHLCGNKLYPRMLTYFLGMLCLLFLWTHLLFTSGFKEA